MGPIFRPETVVDENNNEVDNNDDAIRGDRPAFRHRHLLVLLVGLVLLMSGTEGRLLENKSKLDMIRSLSATSGGHSSPYLTKHGHIHGHNGHDQGQGTHGGLQDPEVCYDDGCLDAAFDILHAANLSVNPCDDFFEFACGRWVASNPVPPSASRWSRFNGLRDEVNRITQSILNEGTNTDDAKPVNQVKEFYAACVDLEGLESAGLDPVTSLLIDFGRWPILNPSFWNASAFDWLQTTGELRRRLLDDALISVYVDRDLKNTSRNVVFLDQPSFGLPRSVLINWMDYPLLIAAYKTFIVEVAVELGSTQLITNIQAAAQAIIDLEIQLANVTVSDEDRYDIDSIYNPYLLNEFQALTDGLLPGYSLDWKKVLDQVFSSSGVTVSPNEQLNIAGLPYLVNALPIFRDAQPQVVADYLGWRVASGTIGETTQAMRDIVFKFTQALTGARQPQPRTESCANAANNNFGMAIGVKYIEAAFDTEAKTRVDELVENLRVSFKELVDEAEWMEDVTKTEAQAKADAIRSFMAFPEWLDNKTAIEQYYEGLELVNGPQAHFQSVLGLALWSSERSLRNLRIPTTQDEWLTYPGVVNAFYSPQHNSITFPAGILQPPFFGKTRPASQNYGGIGVVIGHEITHGFDNQGSQFDKDGNAINWWDDATKAAYLEKTTCIVDQYSDFYLPNVDMYVNGELTQGENIADNGGLRESFKAYRHYVAGIGREEGRLPGLEFLTPNQLFFLGYANIWCEAITDEGLVNQLLTDPHSPARFRVIGPLRNNVDFAAAYNCPVSDDGMNPPESQKCTVW